MGVVEGGGADAAAWVSGAVCGRRELLDELGGECVLGSQGHDLLELTHGRFGVALGQVVICQDETAGRRFRIRGGERLQLAELGRVDVDVRVETGHGGPVPARSDGKHGVERPRGKVVLADREEDQCPELVERGVVGKDLQGLIGESKCAGIVAGAEGSPRRVELRDGRVIDRRIRKVTSRLDAIFTLDTLDS